MPSYEQTSKVPIAGEGGGSTALAQMISSHLKQPDVFISASPAADQLIMGKNHGNFISWYANLATDSLVLAYNPHSRFAAQLSAAANGAKGAKPWYEIVQEPGFLLGRTDPTLDPKGARTLVLGKLAADEYHKPGLSSALFGPPNNPKQIFPEETLVARLTTGQLDAVVAYRHEAVEWGVPFVSLPDAINLGNPADAAHYASATVQIAPGKTERGAPIMFTVAVLNQTQHRTEASDFVRWLLTGQGHHWLTQEGFGATAPVLSGDSNQAPASLRALADSGGAQGGSRP